MAGIERADSSDTLERLAIANLPDEGMAGIGGRGHDPLTQAIGRLPQQPRLRIIGMNRKNSGHGLLSARAVAERSRSPRS